MSWDERMLFVAFRGRSFLFCPRKKEILISLCAISSFSVSLWWKKPASMSQQKFRIILQMRQVVQVEGLSGEDSMLLEQEGTRLGFLPIMG
jgi:hypothetical protein